LVPSHHIGSGFLAKKQMELTAAETAPDFHRIPFSFLKLIGKDDFVFHLKQAIIKSVQKTNVAQRYISKSEKPKCFSHLGFSVQRKG